MQGLIGSCKNTTKIYNFPLIFSLCYDIIFNCQSNFGWVPEWPKGADCKSVAIASKVRILLRPFYTAAE